MFDMGKVNMLIGITSQRRLAGRRGRQNFSGVFPGLRRFLSKNIPSCGSFCPSSLLRKCSHSRAMLPFPRREDAQKSSVIWDILFRQSPKARVIENRDNLLNSARTQHLSHLLSQCLILYARHVRQVCYSRPVQHFHSF